MLLAHENIYGEFGAIEHLNLYTLTLLPCQSNNNKYFKSHVFFVCHFVIQFICLYVTGKVAVSARAMSSDVRWRRIFLSMC